MEFQHRVLHGLPVILLACALLPAPAPAQFAQQAKLVGTDTDIAQRGQSVAISADGNTAILGGPRAPHGSLNGNVPTPGAAYVFARSGGVWTEQATLVSAESGLSEQGYSVALSGDGNTALVGAPAAGFNGEGYVGAAWVFTRSGAGWSQQGTKLVGTGSVSSGSGLSDQGSSVALSGDGNTAILGGPGDNGSTGAAWMFTRSRAGRWRQQGPKLVGAGAVGNAQQGWSVSLSDHGNTAIVGAPTDGFDGEGYPGAAWVFTRSRGVWSQQGTKLVGVDAAGYAGLGASVSLAGNGNIAIVGGPDDDSGAGAAWMFTRSRAVWSQQGTKLIGTGSLGAANQGASVSLSGDGKSAVVGGPLDNGNAGAAWMFARSRGVWSQQGTKLVGTGSLGDAYQGASVSLSGDAGTALVGGPMDDYVNTGGPNWNPVGAAWTYARTAIAGIPGTGTCIGRSVEAMIHQYKGLRPAAAALGVSDARAVTSAIVEYCGESN